MNSKTSSPLFDTTVNSVFQYVRDVYNMDLEDVCFSRTMIGLTAGLVLNLTSLASSGIHVESVTAMERGFFLMGVSFLDAVFVTELSENMESIVIQFKESIVEFPFILHLSGVCIVYYL